MVTLIIASENLKVNRYRKKTPAKAYRERTPVKLPKPVKAVVLRLNKGAAGCLRADYMHIHIVGHRRKHSHNAGRNADAGNHGVWRRHKKYYQRNDAKKHRQKTHCDKPPPANCLVTDRKCSDLFYTYPDINGFSAAITNSMKDFMYGNEKEPHQNTDWHK